MAIEERARAAGVALRDDNSLQMDVAAARADLDRRVRSRAARRRTQAGLGVVAAVLASGALLVTGPGWTVRAPTGAYTPSASAVGSVLTVPWQACRVVGFDPCTNLSPGSYRLPLVSPVTVRVPHEWNFAGDGSTWARATTRDGLVMLVVTPVGQNDGDRFTAASDVHALRSWVAAQPGITVTGAGTTTVSGSPAQWIDVVAEPAAPKRACEATTTCWAPVRGTKLDLLPGHGPWRFYFLQASATDVTLLAFYTEDGTRVTTDRTAGLLSGLGLDR